MWVISRKDHILGYKEERFQFTERSEISACVCEDHWHRALEEIEKLAGAPL